MPDRETRVRWQINSLSVERLVLLLVLVIGAALRFYGTVWDDGHWLHPDERQIFFVAEEIGLPQSLSEFLHPDSPLNPKFFAYGSFPIYLLKLAAAIASPISAVLQDTRNLHLIGRPLAAVLDLGSVILAYCLVRRLWPTRSNDQVRWDAILAAIFASVAVLPVQIAHFYTVDSVLTFLVMVTLVLCAAVMQGGGWAYSLAAGASLGLALATKVSALPLCLVILVAHIVPVPGTPRAQISQVARLTSGARRVVAAAAIAAMMFVLAQPYALIDWPTFVADTLRESQIARGSFEVPYTLQYTGTTPYLYSIWQLTLWGLGVPLGLVAWGALLAALVRWLRQGAWQDTLLLTWAAPYLAITGLLYTRHLRYMLPLVPVLCILAARALVSIKPRALRLAACWLVIVASLVYSVSFASLYARPHPWVAASEWIYSNAPPGSTLLVEEWDRALPLPLDVGGRSFRMADYDVRALPVYDEPDREPKWAAIASDLVDSDYLVFASRRAYGPLSRLPERFPFASQYYAKLLSSELGFELVGEFVRDPGWLNPRFPPLTPSAPRLLRADESFVVYDHPRALIFRNNHSLTAEEILQRLR